MLLIFLENATCEEPVIRHGFANTSNGTSIGSEVKVQCDNGYILHLENKYAPDSITCLRYGYWDDTPTCLPIGRFHRFKVMVFILHDARHTLWLFPSLHMYYDQFKSYSYVYMLNNVFKDRVNWERLVGHSRESKHGL